jgi:hypothetical protein
VTSPCNVRIPPDASPAATACFRTPLRFGPFRTPTPLSPACRDRRSRPRVDAFGAETVCLRVGGHVPRAVKGQSARPPPNLPRCACADAVPSALPALDCTPPVALKLRPPCPEKVPGAFSDAKGARPLCRTTILPLPLFAAAGTGHDLPLAVVNPHVGLNLGPRFVERMASSIRTAQLVPLDQPLPFVSQVFTASRTA